MTQQILENLINICEYGENLPDCFLPLIPQHYYKYNFLST